MVTTELNVGADRARRPQSLARLAVAGAINRDHVAARLAGLRDLAATLEPAGARDAEFLQRELLVDGGAVPFMFAQCGDHLGAVADIGTAHVKIIGREQPGDLALQSGAPLERYILFLEEPPAVAP